MNGLTGGDSHRAFQRCEEEQAVRVAFVTALLLGRDAQLAEAAVVACLPTNDRNEWCETLLRATIRSVLSMLPFASVLSDRGADQASKILPPELRRILRLPQELRCSYVLRNLIGWPAGVCARVLQISKSAVEERSFAAVQELVRLTQQQATA